MTTMKFRKILIILAWAVIATALIGFVLDISINMTTFKAMKSRGVDSLSFTILSIVFKQISHFIYWAAVSALCFYAAHAISPLWPDDKS